MVDAEPTRPNPDSLLAAANEKSRGRLKVFLGLARGSAKPTPCYKKPSACVLRGWMCWSAW